MSFIQRKVQLHTCFPATSSSGLVSKLEAHADKSIENLSFSVSMVTVQDLDLFLLRHVARGTSISRDVSSQLLCDLCQLATLPFSCLILRTCTKNSKEFWLSIGNSCPYSIRNVSSISCKYCGNYDPDSP